jgi:DNA topoisomerase-1
MSALVHVNDSSPGISRRRAGKGFAYRDPRGRPLRDKAAVERIRKLVIPPAWTDVWICPDPNGHLQATGRDARKRKQHRYHPDFREAQEAAKFEHMLEFARTLPRIRAAVARHMRKKGLPREKALATIVHLLETTLIRVGNDDYAKSNDSYGLTTLQDRHAKIAKDELRFQFTGKSGKSWKLSLKDKRVAKIVKAAQDLPGQRLFQYLDADGVQREVTSSDINAYLTEIGAPDITAKDFRTWAGTVLAGMALAEFQEADGEAAAKRNIREAIERVAQRLGNTPTICRKCYVHPALLESYLDHSFALATTQAIDTRLKKELHGLSPEEAAVLAFLRTRLKKRAAKARGR